MHRAHVRVLTPYMLTRARLVPANNSTPPLPSPHSFDSIPADIGTFMLADYVAKARLPSTHTPFVASAVVV